MTTLSPERNPPCAPGDTHYFTRCAYCGRTIFRTDSELADLPYPEVGPCCSDTCSIIRNANTVEYGGVR